MKTPSTRRERVNWLKQKFGESAALVWADKTDREVKKEFEKMYLVFRNKPDDISLNRAPSVCIVCHSEVEWRCFCGCGEGMAIFDQDDPDYEERINEWEGEKKVGH